MLQGGPFEQVTTDVGPLWMLTSDEVMRPYMLERGRWNEPTADLLRSLIRPGCRFLDVGASFGYFSVFAHHVAEGVEIDSVEPHPVIHSALHANLWTNNVPARRWRVALADTRTLLPMSSAPMNPGDSRLGEHAPDQRYDLVVPDVSADELFGGRSFDVVMVAVKGFETEVLLGMQRIVRASPGIVLIVEFSPASLRDRGLDPTEVVNTIRSMDFAVAVHDDWGIGNCAVEDVVAHCDSAGPNGHVNLVLRPER
jgi:FkbM family methyltransferase